MMRTVFVVALLFPVVLLLAVLGMERVEHRLDTDRTATPEDGPNESSSFRRRRYAQGAPPHPRPSR